MEDSYDRLGFRPQKEIIYNRLLPYSESLHSESQKYLSEIKFHLGNAILKNLIAPEALFWMEHLAKYIKLYGLKFSKKDHCHFIHLLLEVLVIPDLAPHCVQKIAMLLHILLKKVELLSREDLQIEWRPLYLLLERILYSNYEGTGLLMLPNNIDASLKALVRVCRPYFSVESTQEMLDEWKPLLCPYDTMMCKAMQYFELFLCTKLPPHQHDRGFKLWLDDFFDMWDSCQNSPIWESHIFWLFARLASDNIGYINWESHIPMVFNRLVRSLNLPSAGTAIQVQRVTASYIKPATVWIVSMMGGGSCCQSYINHMFKALESYYHPSNSGRWMSKLYRMLSRFPLFMVNRLHRERYKPSTWETPIPQECHLTDAEITQFVVSMKPAVLLAMFSKAGPAEPAMALHNLAILRPEIMIPPIIERLYSSLETVVEPHRLVAAMHCMVSVIRSMVQKNPHYPEGPTHVLPLLMGALPGIDPNDIKKCLSTFHFISTVASLVFFVDCSKGSPDLSGLSEIERELVYATAAFEDFVLLLMDRCFAMIENSCFSYPRHIDQNNQHLTSEETVVEVCLLSTFRTVLTHSSPEIFQSALNKLFTFVSTHVFEINMAGRNAANLCRSAARVNSKLTLKKFVPHFTRLVLSLTENEEIAQEERILDNELLFSLLVLSEVVRCDGTHVLEYLDGIENVLRQTLHLNCREGSNLACSLLHHTLKSFTLIFSLNYSSIPDLLERCNSPDAYTLINDWGKPADMNNLDIKCHFPSDEELNAIQRLLENFLLPELKTLQDWAAGSITLTRKKVLSSLNIVCSCLSGAASVLPLWPSKPLILHESAVPLQCSFVNEGMNQEINTKDGRNFRLLVFETLLQVIAHMWETSEDDTKSWLCIITTCLHLVFQWGIYKEDFDLKWKSFNYVKRVHENQLHGRKQHIRALFIDRACLQHEMRLLEKNKYIFTEEHAAIMRELMKLSLSHYFDVRSKAQHVLQYFLQLYEYSYKVILPDLLHSFTKDPMQFHEEFKGALYLILHYKQKSLITVRHWELWNQLWPALVSAKHSEKPSIIKLLDLAHVNVQKYLDTIQIKLEVPESCYVQVRKLWDDSNPSPSGPLPTEDELAVAKELHIKANHTREQAYLSLIGKLAELMESGTLHWRSYHLAFTMLTVMLRYDVKLPASVVRIFVTHLNHDTLQIRKIAISGLCSIMYQQKRPHPEIEIDPCSPELLEESPYLKNDSNPHPTNMWLQYNSSTAPRDKESWDKKRFVHKTHLGFSCWPRPFMVYAPDSEQPKLDRSREELSAEEKPIYDSFIQEEFVEKLISFLSIEERKGHDKLDVTRFEMFKRLFTNFGDTFLENFLKHLRRLTQDKQESQQRCAAEITSGLIRGSKHWNFEKIEKLKERLIPILVSVVENVTPETLSDWTTCFATSSEGRDPNKYYWLFEFLMERPVQQESGSFLESSWMFLLLGSMMQQEWRVSELQHRMLAYLMPRLNHSYHIVREKIGSMLSNIFMFDVPLHCDALQFAPKRSEFLSALFPKVAILETSEQDSSEEDGMNTDNIQNNHSTSNEVSSKRKDAINLFHTLCRWLIMSITRTHYAAPPEIFQMFPVLCSMQNDTSDAALHRDYAIAFRALSQALLQPIGIDAAINSLKQVEQKGSWHSRVAAVSYVQHLVFSNLFTIIHHKSWVEEVEGFVLRHLHDERVEVREVAGEALGSLIHYEVIPITESTLSLFKQKCSKKLRKQVTLQNNQKLATCFDPAVILERHAGILGLCACISAYPYDVPDFMPDVLMILGDHLHDPQPIQTTVKKTLSNFRRTHYDSWRDHKLKFTDDQLSVITELLVSPNYYA